MKKLLPLILIIITHQINAQIIGSNVFLKGQNVEVGISNCGSMGTSVPPHVDSGYHNNVLGRGLGFVADVSKNGWTVPGPYPLPNYCGDYFLPGSPVEGWALQIGTTNYRNSNDSFGICNINNIPGSIINYYSTTRGKIAVWESSGLVGGAIRVTITTFVPDTGIAIVNKVELENVSSSYVRDVYYLRHLDPDNDQPWTGGSYQTQNIIVSQGHISGEAIITTKSILGCYMAIGAVDLRAKVAVGGFAPTSLISDVYNGVAPYITTVGYSSIADVAVQIAFKIDSIAPGAVECLSYAYVLNSSYLRSSIVYADPITYCTPSVFPPISSVSGRTYIDVDNNCNYDTISDYPKPFQNIVNSSGYSLASSDMYGKYQVLYSDTGWLHIQVDTNSTSFNTVCPDSGYYKIYFDSIPDTLTNTNFGDTNIICYDPILNIYCPSLRSCDTSGSRCISISIINPTAFVQRNLNLIVQLNDSLTINSAFGLPYTYLGANNYMIDIVDSILPYSTLFVHIRVNTGCDSAGTLYTYSARLTGISNCGTFLLNDNDATFLTNSYDPNEKKVRIYNTENLSYTYENSIDSLSELEYIIYFQNSGTDSAIFIKIHDLIDAPYLDPSTVELTGFSHPCRYTLNSNKLDIYFENIYLPHGSESNPNTHGFVSFKIKQRTGNIKGTTIYNKSYIYFDYNPPIHTNYSTSRIVNDPTNCNYIISNFSVTPLSCYMDSNAAITFSIYGDIETVTYSWSNGMSSQNISNLHAGLYTLIVSDSANCQTVRSFIISNPTTLYTKFNEHKDLYNCEGDISAFIILAKKSASDSFNYLWSTGSNLNTISNLVSGIYTVTVCNNVGCCETKNYLVQDVINPNVRIHNALDSICKGTSALLYAQGASTYIWLHDNSVNDTLVTPPVTSNITYTVVGTDTNGCVDTTELILYTKICNVGIQSANSSLFSIYPNPTDGIFTISARQLISKIEIVNTSGEIVYTIDQCNVNTIPINVSSIQNGIYFVKVFTNNNVYLNKLVIK